MALRIIFRKISTKSQQMLYLQLCSFNLSNWKSCATCIKHYSIETHILNNNLNKRHLCSNVYSSDTEQNDEDLEICDNTNQITIRSLLYPDSTDTLVSQLNECASVENVFNIIRENYNSFQSIHISQAILVLWDLQKIFYKHNIFYENDNNSSTILTTNAILKNYMDQVNAHEDFEKLMQLVEEKFKDFSLDALTCSLLYLNRMGVKLKTNTMQHMIARCETEIKNCDVETFPLTALSRFIVTLFSQDSLWPNIISINSMPIILNRLDSCETAEDFKLLTICLNKMQQLVSNEHLHRYKIIAEKLIENDVIKSDNYRVIIKALRFLSQPQWHEYCTTTINQFMYLLKGRIDQLTSKELIILFKVFQMQKEPADMLEEIQKHASKLLQKMEGEIDSSVEIILDLLSCIVSFSSPLQRPRFEKLAKRYIENNLTPLSLSALYKILYHIKSSDTELCNMFWDRSLQCVHSDTPTDTLQNLISICHKYMHFSQDIGTRYRYYKFENTIIKMLLKELDNNILSYIPSKFARVASFVIAFSNDIETVEDTVQRLIDMSHRFNSSDCLIVSKGLQFAMENIKFRKDEDIKNLINSLAESLDKCSLKEMKQNNDLPNINILLRGYIIRKGNMNDELFLKLIKHYDGSSEIFSSNIAKDLTFALQRNNCFIPESIDLLTNYVIKKKEAVLGNIAERVLSVCYTHGYTPKNNDEFLSIASKLIIRDKSRFSGLAFLQACLGLCYFHRLPEILVKLTFSVEFLEKLDEELSNCYAKMTYPTRVRDHLMQLNRAVCIDYPESNVPWFHQKYVDELKKQVPKKDVFQRRVFGTLNDIFTNTDTKVIEDSYSPYGYHLDFEIKHAEHMTERTGDSSPRRTAVLLLKSSAFTNFNTNLKGYYQLRQRHLEMLGYKVIGVNYSEWTALCIQEKCIAYLKSKM